MRRLALLLFASTAFAQTFEISPPSFGQAPGGRSLPRIAASASGYLVAWYDYRGDSSTIRIRRIDLGGLPIDDRDLVVAGGLAFDVASDGTDYLLTHAICADADCADTRTHFVRITRDAMRRGPQRVAGVPRAIARIGSGGEFAVAISEGGALRLMLVDRSGVIVREPFTVPDGSPNRGVTMTETFDGRVAIAFGNANGGDVRSAVLSRDDLAAGRVSSQIVATSNRAPTILGVTATRGSLMVAWSDDITTYLVALDANGGVLARSDVVRRTFRPLLASTGTTHLLFDERNDVKIVYRRIGDRAAIAPEELLSGRTEEVAGSMDSAVAADGSGAVLAYASTDWPIASWAIRIARIDPAGNVVPWFGRGLNLATGFAAQDMPAVAPCNGGFAVVWREVDEQQTIRIRRFTRSGIPLDPPERRVTAPPVHAQQRSPHVACNGLEALVSWVEDRNGFAAGPIDIRFMGAYFLRSAFTPAVGELGGTPLLSSRLVAFNDTSFSIASEDFSGITIAATGTDIPPRRFSLPGKNVVALGANGLDMVVAWATSRDVRAMRISRFLQPIGPEVKLADTPTHPVVQLSVESSPQGWMIAWIGTSADDRELFKSASMLLDRNLSPLDPIGGVPFPMTFGGAFNTGWDGCAYELMLSDRTILRPPFGVDSTIEPRRAVATLGGDRFVMTDERDADGVPRLLGRVEPIAPCASQFHPQP
jgi:hypothetical protein